MSYIICRLTIQGWCHQSLAIPLECRRNRCSQRFIKRMMPCFITQMCPSRKILSIVCTSADERVHSLHTALFLCLKYKSIVIKYQLCEDTHVMFTKIPAHVTSMWQACDAHVIFTWNPCHVYHTRHSCDVHCPFDKICHVHVTTMVMSSMRHMQLTCDVHVTDMWCQCNTHVTDM